MNSKVSIVIACYNDPEVIGAVRSAVTQTYKNKEVILIDDGSNEETRKIINSLKEEVDIHICLDNGGQGRARNRGIEQATGDLILNLDSDDLFEETFCEKAVAVFEKDRDVKIVSCLAKRFDKSGLLDVFIPKGGELKDFLFSNSALGSSMFRRTDWLKCGGYEEDLNFWGFEDWELYIRLLKEGGYAYVMQEELFKYRIRESSTTSIIKPQKHQRFKMILLKHKELYRDHFEDTIEHLIGKIERLEQEKENIKKGREYSLGKKVLEPLKSIKRKIN